MKEKEIWKPLEIYNGEYAVSSFGRVMSLKYGKKRILKTSPNDCGYPQVTICFEKKMYQNNVHSLVAIGFGILRKGFDINHIDGNKRNNNLKNLEACTRSHNIKHSYKMGLQKPLKGELNPQAKINMKIANQIRKEVSSGKKQIVVCRKYKLSKTNVSNIVNNKRWAVTP